MYGDLTKRSQRMGKSEGGKGKALSSKIEKVRRAHVSNEHKGYKKSMARYMEMGDYRSPTKFK